MKFNFIGFSEQNQFNHLRNGFLGRQFGKTLSAAHEVILTSRNNSQNAFAKKFTGCEMLPLDITHIEAVCDVLKGAASTLDEINLFVEINDSFLKRQGISAKMLFDCLRAKEYKIKQPEIGEELNINGSFQSEHFDVIATIQIEFK